MKIDKNISFSIERSLGKNLFLQLIIKIFTRGGFYVFKDLQDQSPFFFPLINSQCSTVLLFLILVLSFQRALAFSSSSKRVGTKRKGASTASSSSTEASWFEAFDNCVSIICRERSMGADNSRVTREVWRTREQVA